MKKVFSLMVALLIACAANAKLGTGYTFGVELGLGSQFEFSGRLQKQILPTYLAWDVVTLKYSNEWSALAGSWGIKTGLRGFTPKFGPGVKGFAALDMGYSGLYGGGYLSAFGMDFTVGAMWKHFSLGYGFNSAHNGGTAMNHFARIGFTF